MSLPQAGVGSVEFSVLGPVEVRVGGVQAVRNLLHAPGTPAPTSPQSAAIS